jgi:hypothetical protein
VMEKGEGCMRKSAGKLFWGMDRTRCGAGNWRMVRVMWSAGECRE